MRRTNMMHYAMWNRLAADASKVIALRAGLVPLWWVTNPARAQRETQRMVAEKQAALLETQLQILQTPIWFWLDVWQQALRVGQRTDGLQYAQHRAAKRLVKPSSKRVHGNRQRLGRALK